MPSIRPTLPIIALFALHGLARRVDGALGLVLRADLPEPRPWAWLLQTLLEHPLDALAPVLLWATAGAVVGLAVSSLPRDAPFVSPLKTEPTVAFLPLLLRPALTAAALVAVVASPAYPYGFAFPVALTQDLGPAQDAAAVVAILAAVSWPRWRPPAPGRGAVFLMSFLAYALMTPGWARHWDGHPGNEPKYLRQAVAISHGLTLDAEGVSAAMERLEPAPLGESLGRALRSTWNESAAMTRALMRGPAAFDRSSIRARRITRQTVLGKTGGVFYVLAPGPSLLIAPALRLDRALNLAREARGTAAAEGRLAVAILVMNLFGAALVTALFVLARAATGRPGLAALVAFGFAFLPPQLFYSYQFYPEMLAALVVAVAVQLLCFTPIWSWRTALGLGIVLATLPWLHQKFLPLWAVLTLAAVAVCWRLGLRSWGLLLLLAPQLLTGYLTLLYNFAITGSPRPDALFLAWGPAGVTTAHIGQGLLGLLFDARYGLLPYVPLYLVGVAGIAAGGPTLRRLLPVVPAVLVYYLTVSAADNWAGAVCNLGRYIMPALPLLVVLVAVVLDRGAHHRGLLTVVSTLAIGSGLVAWGLWGDPHAANDSWRLLSKAAFFDGRRYIPDLFIRQWSDAAPGTAARVVAWIALAVALALYVRRALRALGDGSPRRALAGLAFAVLLTAAVLETWPGPRLAPGLFNCFTTAQATTLCFPDSARIVEDGVVLDPGAFDLLVRSRSRLTALRLLVGGQGWLKSPGAPPLALRDTGAIVEIPLTSGPVFQNSSGLSACFSRLRLDVDGTLMLRLDENWGNLEVPGPVHE